MTTAVRNEVVDLRAKSIAGQPIYVRSRASGDRLPALPRVLHILPHGGGGGEAIVDRLEALRDFEHERAYLATTRNPVRAGPWIALNRVRLPKRAAHVDLLHVIGDMAAILTLSLLRRRPTVIGTHGLHFLRRARGLGGVVARRRLAAAVAASQRTVCTSLSELEELRRVTDGAGNLLFVANGVATQPPEETQRAAVRAELGLEEGETAVLYLGQLEPRKEPMFAVSAARRAAARGERVVLLIAGDGALAGDVRAAAGPVVRPLGFRGDPQRLLAAADVFVMPSAREGLSLAVLEAMAAGLPTVVSDGPGNPEAVGDAGVVVPAGDVEALASALAALANDPAERRRLGMAGRRRVEQRFTLERYLTDMREVFLEALGEQPDARERRKQGFGLRTADPRTWRS